MIKANTMQKLLGHSQAYNFILCVVKTTSTHTHTHTQNLCSRNVQYKVTLPSPQHDNCPSKFWRMNNHEPHTPTSCQKTHKSQNRLKWEHSSINQWGFFLCVLLKIKLENSQWPISQAWVMGMYVFESFVFCVVCDFHMRWCDTRKNTPPSLIAKICIYFADQGCVSCECTCWTTTLYCIVSWCSPSRTYVGLLKSDIEICNSWSARSCVRKYKFNFNLKKKILNRTNFKINSFLMEWKASQC